MLVNDVKEMIAEQVQYRGLLYQMTKRDLLLRYKQTVMGFAWAVFTPLLNTAIFSVIFTKMARLDVEGPYPLFAYCGLWVWNFSASSLKFAVGSLTANTNLVTKIYFPREIFPLSAVIVSMVDFAVASVPLIAMMIYYQVPVTPAIVVLPLILAVQVALTVAIALLLSMWNLFFRDVKYVFEVLIAVGMFATSALLPVPSGTLGTLMWLNPMTPIIEAYRSVLLYGRWPAPGPMLGVAAFSLVLLGWAWLTFHRSEFQFAENA